MNIIHSSRNTKGLYCDGKPCFEVLLRRRRMGDEERYYCDVRHCYIDPHDFNEGNCPRHNSSSQFKPKFNWW